MRELNVFEIEPVDGGSIAYDVGYAVGNAVESVGVAIGGALSDLLNAAKQYSYTH